MATIISKSKSDYLHQPTQDNLHKETTDWLSEIEFSATELAFLNKLTDKRFLRNKGAQNINKLNALDKKVKSFQRKTLKTLNDEVIHHEQHLGALDENMFSQNEQSIREEHKKYRAKVIALRDAVKKIKLKIFPIVEKQLQHEKRISGIVQKGHKIVNFPVKEPFNDF